MIAEGVLGFNKCVSQMDLDSKDVEIKESKKRVYRYRQRVDEKWRR